MADGPTKVEAAWQRLGRAALGYGRAGRRPGTTKNSERFARAQRRLCSAAIAFSVIMEPKPPRS
jgi:hypothetical protein